jgi:C-terminal processing protease CtpA/Prc
MKPIFYKLSFLIISTIVIINFSCKKEVVAPNAKADSIAKLDSVHAINKIVYDFMKNYYLWDTLIPTVDYTKYSTPDSFLNAIIYKPIDKWSFIITKTEYDAAFIQGAYYGHGFALGLDAQGRFRIKLVFKNSDLYTNGVKRGWIISKINGTTPDTINVYNLLGGNIVGLQNTFSFIKNDGSSVTLVSTKKELTMNMVLSRDTFHVGNKVVGYISFYEFLGDAVQELNEAFDYFNSTGVSELVLDMRYNTGGDLNIASYLAGMIGGAVANNQTFVTLTYNKKNTNSDTTFKIQRNARTLNLTRLFAITTKSTASASEAVINGLTPYMPVKLIGSQTYGKPTGMNVIQIPNYNYYLVPVMFKLTNQNGKGDYFNGLPVDQLTTDDLDHDFGDRNESCLHQALYYIQTGKFDASLKSYYVPYERPKKGWKLIMDVY